MEAVPSEVAHAHMAATAAAGAAAPNGQHGKRAALAAEDQHGARTTSAYTGQRPSTEPSARNAATGTPSAQQLATMRFKLIDFGHADVHAFHR